MKIFVAGLPYDLDDAELEEFFEKFGTVASAKVATDRETGKSRGFGFVEMPHLEEAKEAIEGLNNIALGNNKVLVVKEAEERNASSAPPRNSYSGGRSSNGNSSNGNSSNGNSSNGNSGYLKGGYNPNNRRY